MLETRLEGGGVGYFGVVEYQHGRAGPDEGLGIEGINDKGRVQGPFAGTVGGSLVVAMNKPSTLKRWL